MQYFPSAFAVSDDRPMEFNFDLRLLDTLVLRKPILPRNEERDLALSTERSDDSDQRVTFERGTPSNIAAKNSRRGGESSDQKKRGNHAWSTLP